MFYCQQMAKTHANKSIWSTKFEHVSFVLDLVLAIPIWSWFMRVCIWLIRIWYWGKRICVRHFRILIWDIISWTWLNRTCPSKGVDIKHIDNPVLNLQPFLPQTSKNNMLPSCLTKSFIILIPDWCNSLRNKVFFHRYLQLYHNLSVNPIAPGGGERISPCDFSYLYQNCLR